MPRHTANPVGVADVLDCEVAEGKRLQQTRRMALVEALANVVVGYLVAVVIQLLAFPAFGIRLSLGESIRIGLVFTAASLARGYMLRRLFERVRIR